MTSDRRNRSSSATLARAGAALALVLVGLFFACRAPSCSRASVTSPGAGAPVPPVGSASWVVTPKSTAFVTPVNARAVTWLRETLFRGHLDGRPVIFWITGSAGAHPGETDLTGRFHRDADGEDTNFHGICDQDGHLTLASDAGALLGSGKVEPYPTTTGDTKFVVQGNIRVEGEDVQFRVGEASRLAEYSPVEFVVRKLYREEHKGTSDHCVVDIEYIEFLQAPATARNFELSALHNPPFGDLRCVRGVTRNRRDTVVINEGEVLSLDSWNRERRTPFRPVDTQANESFFSMKIPSGAEIDLADIITYAPGSSVLAEVLEPAFTKALGGSHKDARVMLKDLRMYEGRDPVEPERVLVTSTGVRLLWAWSGRTPIPSPSGVWLDFATLLKKKLLNQTGLLSELLVKK